MTEKEKRTRASWDEYFMRIAREVSSRATCDRKHVGAVIVRERSILATGYNGSIHGAAHCDEAGHMMVDGHCVRTIHAEANAVIQAARNGVRIDGAEIYVTASPCWACFKMIANAGIERIVYGEFYRDERIFEFAKALGIDLVHVSHAGPLRIYIASKAEHGPSWRALLEQGYPISSSWIHESGRGETKDFSALWTRNVTEAASATHLIAYHKEGETPKGALIEIGAALAHGVPVLWVGPAFGSIVEHPAVHFGYHDVQKALDDILCEREGTP